MTVSYKPQYRNRVDQGAPWLSAGYEVDEKTALSMVRAKMDEYTGKYPTKRICRVITEVVDIETTVKFKETK